MTLRLGTHPDAIQELGDAIERYDLGGQSRGSRIRADLTVSPVGARLVTDPWVAVAESGVVASSATVEPAMGEAER